jgi:hypothetical protein
MKEVQKNLIGAYMLSTNREYILIHDVHIEGMYQHLKQIGMLSALFTYHDPENLELEFSDKEE